MNHFTILQAFIELVPDPFVTARSLPRRIRHRISRSSDPAAACDDDDDDDNDDDNQAFGRRSIYQRCVGWLIAGRRLVAGQFVAGCGLSSGWRPHACS